MIDISRLISHRFRGFSNYENSIAGLNAALDFGVQQVEFDIRVTACGTPLIYHDEHAKDALGRSHMICDVMAVNRANLGGVFAHMPTAEALFAAIAAHENTSCKLLIDMKDAGFEDMLYALIRANNLQERVIWVSWLPETLYAVHDLDPSAKLCLSHWCQSPNDITRKVHAVYTAKNGEIARPDRRYVHGERSGWFVDGTLRGAFRRMLHSVCVPQDMVTRSLVESYHRDNIRVSTFSYIDWDYIRDHENRFKIDDYFIDNKMVFDQIT
ncbi:glycerophosphodiester phosphodiesterase [Litorimonas sp. RW-G-Af-16]|uniref:glycerophosphodiester phosphodiesterase n=1 Tax=Litorimonas sp. RW-G-Af-16 TaxID=3241168 RepID=UPI00390C7BEA